MAKLFIWTDHHSYLVVAHADSLERGRTLALAEIGTTDGSCPNRQKVISKIKEFNPTIWNGDSADYAIQESADLAGIPEILGVTHFS